MNTIVRLHRTRSGAPIIVNLNQMKYVEVSGSGSTLITFEGDTLIVAETLEEIMELAGIEG